MANEVSTKHLVLIGVVIGALFGVFALGFWLRGTDPFGGGESEAETHVAPKDEDFTFALGGQEAGNYVSLNMATINNFSVDVLLFDEENYQAYSANLGFNYIQAGSALDIISFEKTWQVTETDYYYWVVDNSRQPADGAYAEVDVEFEGQARK